MSSGFKDFNSRFELKLYASFSYQGQNLPPTLPQRVMVRASGTSEYHARGFRLYWSQA